MHRSLILGIIACCLAAVSGVVMILAGVWMGSMFSSPFFYGSMPDPMFSDMFSNMFSSMTTIYIVVGSVAIASAIPGVVGCVLFKKNRKTSGILLIVAAALSLLSALIAGVLFLLAGIFALSKDKPAAQPMMAVPLPYPGPAPYPPYPPYGAYPPPPPPYPPYGAQQAAPPRPYPPYPPYGAQAAPPSYPPQGAQTAPPPPADGER